MDEYMRTGIKGFIAKSTIISLLALSMGTGPAWADEAETQPTVTADVAATTGATGATAAILTTEPEQQTPSLLPGDFFYFVKTIYERIQLSFAANDMEEAILLAQFAQERLAETAVLFEKGEAEIAEETLKRSLSQQQQAIDTAVFVTDSATTDSTPETSDSSVEADAAAQGAVATDVQTPTEEEEGADSEQADKVKNSLQHNIVALTAALEKVKNPQAQSSLLKNITKSFAHLEKKLTKLSEKNEEVAATKAERAAKAVSSATTAPVGEETAASTDENAESTETEVDDNDNESVKPRQEDKQKPKKAKEQQHASGKPSDKQQKKPAKSHENAGKNESAGPKKEAK